ncbi:MAG: hypothetical protein LBV12_05725 [Puniceicoccales bacterium]|jgi:hypothetical protein|nr:hypothetical protein [Puniceicoccales bacterium]
MKSFTHTVALLILAFGFSAHAAMALEAAPTGKQRQRGAPADSSPLFAASAERESEHPPLPENTKKAIADYKRNPTEANKNRLLKIMNENYDAIIQLKKDKLADRVRGREKNINHWMQAIRSGGVPPFMKLNTENQKGSERKAVAEAMEAYRKDPSPGNEAAVKESLGAYYDVFLAEQKKHIKDTEESREARMTTALERFTSDRFKPGFQAAKTTIKKEDALAEIICSYISVGAEIVPVNPEARVRERSFNSAINTAQANYLKDPTEKNRTKLKEEITKAFQAAYDVRLEEFAKADKKGLAGASALFAQIQDADFRGRQFLELTQQRNLYGRIDRTVTFGSNTVGTWEPRLKTESHALAKLLHEYEESSAQQKKQSIEVKFNDIYGKMLAAHKKHLEETKAKLDIYIEKTLKELTS